MAVAQPEGQPESSGRQPLVLHLDLLHNWSDLIVLSFAALFAVYMATGEFVVGGASISAASDDLQIFAPLGVGLSIMIWRRFRRVALVVDDERVLGISVWGVQKECRLDELTDVTQEGRTLARQLIFRKQGSVAFKVWRGVWTGLQLNTLSVFLGIPVTQAEPLRSRLDQWTAGVAARTVDALFLIVGGAVLVGGVSADLDARAYQRAQAICSELSAVVAGCFAVLPVTVEAIGARSSGHYGMAVRSPARAYETTAVSSAGTYARFSVGMAAYAKLWKGKLTFIKADERTSVETTDNPFYLAGSARTGFPVLIVALSGLVPVLSRLHPVIT